MPLYEYLCDQCGSFEVIRKFSDPALEACPTCNKPVSKLPSAPAIQFKGSGWYVTDYAKKSSGNGASKDKAGGAAKDDKGTPATNGSTAETTSKPKKSSGDSDSK